MTTKPSNIGQWVGAVIAAVVIIGASFLGFHAFNARAHANAELQSGAQSPQSDNTAQSGSQSGDTLQSTEPTPVNRLFAFKGVGGVGIRRSGGGSVGGSFGG